MKNTPYYLSIQTFSSQLKLGLAFVLCIIVTIGEMVKINSLSEEESIEWRLDLAEENSSSEKEGKTDTAEMEFESDKILRAEEFACSSLYLLSSSLVFQLNSISDSFREIVSPPPELS